MMRTIWLASYPKSGNTWFRLLAANLAQSGGKAVDINALGEDTGIASARAPFDNLLLIESGLLSHEETDRFRPRVYEEQARLGEALDPAVAPAVRFVKVHDAYTVTEAGEPLLAGMRGADGAIVIVRDPRDVAPSLANHLDCGLDEAIAFMNDANSCFSSKPDRLSPQLRQKLPGWSGHIATWLDQSDIPVLLVRYEDMTADTAGVLRKALRFAQHPATDEDILSAVRLADFAQAQMQEKENGFRERPRASQGRMFFRRGQVGSWRDELTVEQARRIEDAHRPMMLRLGYEPNYGT